MTEEPDPDNLTHDKYDGEDNDESEEVVPVEDDDA